MASFVICVRSIQKGEFGSDVGPTRYLIVPDEQPPMPDHAVSRTDWLAAVQAAATGATDAQSPPAGGEVLVLVHGFGAGAHENLWRHHRLQTDLRELGYGGVIVSFDWPCAEQPLLRLDGRDQAKLAAMRLCDDGIRLLATQQARGCGIAVHVLAHSAGAYVLREACDDADDCSGIAYHNWVIGQVALIGADVSAATMADGDSKSAALYRHCQRLTNYQSPGDGVLGLGNAPRAGLAPRLGRVGLPATAPGKAVNVDCGAYFAGKKQDDAIFIGPFGHAWHIGDAVFAADLLYTLQGEIDRNYLPTRRRTADGRLELGG
jgi:esterase/lipase superfamily enzyme